MLQLQHYRQTTGSVTGENVSSTKLQFNPSTGALTATSFSGAGTGLTGTASSLSIGGNAATATSATSATSATTATNLANGLANQIAYQTAANTTSFISAPTSASTYLGWNGSAFAWSSVSAGAGGSNTQVQFNSSGALAGSSKFVWDGTSLIIG